MKISKKHFLAVGSGLNIPEQQIETFWTGLAQTNPSESPAFAKYLFYFGAMLVISAMTWFLTNAWIALGGGGIFLIAIAYALLFILTGRALWKKRGYKTPAGLLITAAVCMTPLAIWGATTYFNLGENAYSPYFLNCGSTQALLIEIGTLLAGVTALIFFPFPFLTAPILCSLWILLIDTIQLIMGKSLTWNQESWISLCFGVGAIVTGFAIYKKKPRYEFWSILFGLLAFETSLSCVIAGKGSLPCFIFFMIHVFMMSFAVLARRNTFMVFGAIGVLIDLSYLSFIFFVNSILFPFALSLMGLGILALGILYQKNMLRLESSAREKFPRLHSFFNEGIAKVHEKIV